MDSLAALGRTSVSLVAVLGLLWLITRWLKRSRSAAVLAGGEIAVLSRQAVGHKAGVAVVQIGNRAIVVGVTEAQVTLLSELPLEAVTPKPVQTRTEVILPQQPRVARDLKLSDVPAEIRAGTRGEGRNDSPQLTAATAALGRHATSTESGATTSGLAGSALSPATWTKAVGALRERTTRR